MNGGQYRQSMQIGRKPAANLHHATRLASRIGCSLNQFVTINYSKTSCRPEEASAHFRALLASWFARWLRRHPKNKNKSPPSYVWAFEAAGGQIAVHWLVHIPPGLIREFWRMVPVWVTATTGGEIGVNAVKHRKIYNIVGAKRYVLKGMDPDFARMWQIRPSPQGLIIGKRSGFSRNLGPVARKEQAYRPLRRQVGQWVEAQAA